MINKKRYFDEISYIWYKIYSFIPHTYREIKYAVQRVHRGYSDRDCWSINGFLSDIMPGMLRQLKENCHGCPEDLWDDKKDNKCQKWDEVLIEIAQGFEAATSISNLDFMRPFKNSEPEETWEARRAILDKKFDRGIFLFKKYYFSLWD